MERQEKLSRATKKNWVKNVFSFSVFFYTFFPFCADFHYNTPHRSIFYRYLNKEYKFSYTIRNITIKTVTTIVFTIHSYFLRNAESCLYIPFFQDIYKSEIVILYVMLCTT